MNFFGLLFLRRGDVELEVDDVPVLHHVRLPLLPVFPGGFHLRHALPLRERLEVLVRAHLSLDEPSLEVAVNHPRGLRRERALVQRPAPHFLLPRGEVVDQVQFLVPLDDHLRQRALRALRGVEERLGRVRVFAEIPQLPLELDGERDHGAAAVLFDPRANLHQPLVLLPDEVSLTQVHEIHDRLRGYQPRELLFDHLHLRRGPIPRPYRLVVRQHLLHLVHRRRKQPGELHRRVLLHVHLLLLDRALEVLHVLRAELRLDRLQIPDRVHGVVHVDDLLGVERADDVEDAVHGLDVAQERVPQARALRGAPDQARDVRHVQVRGVLRGRFPRLTQVVVPLVRHRAPRLVRFDRAEREVLRRDRLVRQEVEQRRLPDVG
mmetsp:Transcript_2061/g.6674  ORF Transcript_2061/g.6674 Transcript_2061/m.6674 type:complete len:378 (+) Transcript_2061:67-1200(+)